MAKSNATFLFCLFLGFSFLQGCTTHIKQRQKLHLDPLVFFSRGKKVIEIKQLNPHELFRRGATYFQRKHYRKAVDSYRKIVELFPKSSVYQLSVYNLALSYERLNYHNMALKHYRLVLQSKFPENLRMDATFRVGANLLKLQKWGHARTIYEKLSVAPGLEAVDRIEVLSRLGVALYGQKKFTQANNTFYRAIRLYKRASRKEFLGNDYFAAMAQFYIGKFYERRFQSRAFRNKPEELRQDLDAKASDLLQAQAHYIRTIRIQNAHWIAASLYHIGQLYQRMYKDMLSAPVPESFSAEERKVYQEMLKKRIRNLLNKAIYAYEKNLKASETLGLHKNEWILKTQNTLKTLRKYVIKEFLTEPAQLKKAS